MRQILYATITPWTIAVFAAAAPAPALAQIEGPPGENRFCAQYDDGSAMDCSFPSYAACQAAISGVGGVCMANNFPPGHYVPQRLPQLIPTDPLGLYRDRSQGLTPVPPPP